MTAAGERQRRLLLTAGAALVTRVITLAAPLVTIPLALQYLGPTQYGLWMTISAAASMLAFTDLGLGNGLLTLISNAYGSKDTMRIRKLAAHAYLMMSVVSVLLAALVGAGSACIPWGDLLNARDIPPATVQQVMWTCSICLIAGLPISLIQRIQLAIQEGHQSHVWQCAGAIGSMVSMLLVIRFDLGIGCLIAASLGIPVIFNLLNTLVFFTRQHPEYRPTTLAYDSLLGRSLLRIGIGFCVISVLNTVAVASDNVIVARFANLSDVSVYSIVSRIMSILPMLITFVCIPLWCANGEALACGDVAWVLKATRNAMVAGALLCLIGGAVLTAAAPAALAFWVPNLTPPPAAVWAGFAANAVMIAICSPLFMVLNSSGRLREQVRLLVPFTIGLVLLKIVAADSFGWPALPWVSAAAYAVCAFPMLIRESRSVLSQWTAA